MNQLTLFADSKPTRRPRGGPPGVQDAWAHGFSAPIMDELVARLNARLGQWLGWNDFADIRDRHRIGCCMGHVLANLERAGRIAEKRVYYGTECPTLPGEYRGYGHLWSSIEHGPATHANPAPTTPGGRRAA